MSSKWIAHCPPNHYCTNEACKKYIPEGSICIAHPSGYYGCKECGIKHPEAWAGPIPGAFNDNSITNLYKISMDYVGIECCNCNHIIIGIGKHYLNSLNEYGGWSFCNDCCGGNLPGATGNTDISETEPKTVEPKIITSFAYKNGKPEVLIKHQILDVRKTIRNPWKILEFRKRTGLDPDVRQFVENCLNSKNVVDKGTRAAILYKSIYVGCTGGKHRSVAIAEIIAERLKAKNIPVTVIHRDI